MSQSDLGRAFDNLDPLLCKEHPAAPEDTPEGRQVAIYAKAMGLSYEQARLRVLAQKNAVESGEGTQIGSP